MSNDETMVNITALEAVERAMSSAPWRWRAGGDDAIEDEADQIVLAAEPELDELAKKVAAQ